MPLSPTERLLQILFTENAGLLPASTREWDELMQTAVAHTAAPQLLQRLLPLARDGHVPPTVLQCTWVAASRQKQQTAPLPNELTDVVRCLNERNIEPILLKGAYLATHVYPDISHRPMSDLDLLVRYDDLASSATALEALGYSSSQRVSIDDYCQRSHQLPRLSAEGRTDIELHWTIAKPACDVHVDTDGLWTRSISTSGDGRTARALCPEDLLLHICLHSGAMHLFGEKGIRPLLDVQAILETFERELDWAQFLERAARWGVTSSVSPLLHLSQTYTGARVPEYVLKELRADETPPAILEAARAQLFELPGMRLVTTPEAVASVLVDTAARRSLVFGIGDGQRPNAAGLLRRIAKLAATLFDHIPRLARNHAQLGSVFRRASNAAALQTWMNAQTRESIRPETSDAGNQNLGTKVWAR